VEERSTNLSLQHLRPGEEWIASDLVMRSYRAATTTNDSAEGVEEFTRYASAAGISSRMSQGSVVVMAFLGAVAIGVVEVRRPGHIGLLFICPDHQGRGVGRSLCETAFEAAARMSPHPPKVTVNSAPGAVAFYEKLGFLVAGALTEFNGIRFVPMQREFGV
jgi:GNAT superfamily N-acetyltransferase